MEIEFPIWDQKRTGFGFHETSIRDSDYALAAASAPLSSVVATSVGAYIWRSEARLRALCVLMRSKQPL